MKLFLREKWLKTKDFYFNNIFNDVKKLLINYLIALVVIFIVMTVSFVLRTKAIDWVNNNNNNNGHQIYQVVLNSGISFGILGNNTGLVYFLQIIPVLVSFILVIHSRQWLLTIGISLVFASGFANLLDRMITEEFTQSISNTNNIDGKYYGINTVVDYWKLGGTIINFPDIFIFVGIGWVVVCSLFNNYNENKVKKDHLSSKDQ